MKILISFTVFVMVGFLSFAQVGDPFTPGNSALQVQTKTDSNSELVGSPYFEEQFTPGIIEEIGGNKQNAYLRYNVKDDQVEVKVSPTQSEIYILPRQQKFVYQLKDYAYILGSFNVKDIGLIKGYINQYYQSNKVIFIGKPYVTVSQAQPAKTSYEKATPASINVGMNYYFGFEGEQLHEVRLKEKDFKNVFPSSKEMKQYFDDHKIKDIEEVKKMIKFYEALSS